MTDPKPDIDALVHVARILHDQLKVYPLAVEISDEPQATSVIEGAISQRWSMLEQVEPAIRNLGGDPPTHGSPTGLYHQAATAIHGTVDKGSRTAIYEVEKGEADLHEAIGKYAASDEISAPTRTLMAALDEQLTPVHAAIVAFKRQLES